MKPLFIFLTSVTIGSTAFSQFSQSENFQENKVSLANFESMQKGNSVELSWTASNEINVSSYEIQKSSNGSSFNGIGTVTAQNNGNSFKYTFLDATPAATTNYYRLRSVDKKGNIVFSDVLNVNTGFGRTDIMVLSNPVRGGILKLQLNKFSSGKYAISLYSNAGQKVFSRSLDLSTGSTTETINLPQNIGNGMYFLQVTDGTSRINKQVVLEY